MNLIKFPLYAPHEYRNSMKVKGVTHIDLWTLAALTPLYPPAVNFVLFGKKYFGSPGGFCMLTLVTMAIGLAGWYFHSLAADYIRKRFEYSSQTNQRVFFTLLAWILLTILTNTVIYGFYTRFPLIDFRPGKEQYLSLLLLGVGFNLVTTGLNEGLFLKQRWKLSETEKEHFKRENLQSVLQSLKQQVNPHFLFNSLNALSALINEDPKCAQKYLSELSKVYRYLLRTNENELTTLANELQFIDSYFHLLQTRFGKGVVLLKNIHGQSTHLFLPPLTLQLLVENAVKHNTVGKNKPLAIEIISSADSVLVRNNLQKKTLKVESGKIGLSNIAEKFRLLHKSNIEVLESDGFFTVKVPLIASNLIYPTEELS